MPVDFSTAAADGPVSTLMKALAASACLAPELTPDRVGGVVLDVLRQRPDQGDARLPDDLADLVDADLRLAGS